MTYEEAKNNTFACATRPEGYNGQVVAVEFAFDAESGKTLEVHAHGYHASCIPQAVDTSEALWLIENHPTAKRFYSNVIITEGFTQLEFTHGGKSPRFDSWQDGNLDRIAEIEAKISDAQNVAAFEVQMQQASGKLFL